ncbi:MAG TPA: glycosyltransferase 87 family protein, partial [Acidimicrobiales bacterium]
ISDLPVHAGKLIWDAVDLVVLTALIAVSIAAARARPLARSDWRTALMLVFPVGLLLYPVMNDLQLGQINLVLVLMIVADLVVGVSWRGKRLPPGVLTGLAAALKLTPLVFVPYLLATRQWRAARNMVLTFIAATGLMFVVAPRASWSYFTKDAYDVTRVGNELSIGNQTLKASVLRTHLPLPHSLVDLVLVLMVGGGIALAALAYRRSSPMLGVLLCAATGLMVSPISWNHHYVWIVPALVWLVAGVDRPAGGIVWAAAAALVFMWSPGVPPADSNVIWYLRENAYVFATLVFFASVGAMLWARRRRPAPTPSGVHAQGIRGSTAS